MKYFAVAILIFFLSCVNKVELKNCNNIHRIDVYTINLDSNITGNMNHTYESIKEGKPNYSITDVEHLNKIQRILNGLEQTSNLDEKMAGNINSLAIFYCENGKKMELTYKRYNNSIKINYLPHEMNNGLIYELFKRKFMDSDLDY